MAPSGLVDTGALLALLDRSDRWHGPCVEALRQLRLPLLTSHAVLTELFHLVGDDPREVDAAWRLLRSGAVRVAEIPEAEIADLQELMQRYADCPMDYADATLVHLAQRESLTTVFTVDRRNFAVYRIGGRKRFRVVP